MEDVFVEDGAVTAFGAREAGLLDLVAEAADRLTVPLEDVDRVVVASQHPGELGDEGNLATRVATELGLVPTAATRVETAPSSGSAALEAGVHAVAAGDERVLVVGAESMTRRDRTETSAVLARMIEPRERRLGMAMPGLAGLAARRFLHERDATRRDLAQVPVKAHELGARNPDAHFQEAVTVDDVLGSPRVADPLRLYDCAPVSDGAAALVLSADEGPVEVAGTGHATDVDALADRRYEGALRRFQATTEAARRAYRDADREADDVDLVETHDAFSFLEAANVEDLGLVPEGRGLEALLEGRTRPDGDLPVNVTGGLKARGHPVGATGLAQVAEAARQLQGEGPGPDVGGDVALTHNVGGYGNNVLVTLLEARR
jgi:acetyl-CoA acetyltransferase